jgi:hypothetical protein
MVKQTKLKSITDKIRKYKKYTPPQSNNKDLPPLYNIILSASTKGSGKTYNCIQLLTNYEYAGFKATNGDPCKMRTIWVAGGTARSKQNSILDTLTSLRDEDRIDIDNDIDTKLQIIYDDILAEKLAIEEYNQYAGIYAKFMNKKEFRNLTDDELLILMEYDYIDPNHDPDRPRDEEGNILYQPRVVFLILDDLISTDAFSVKRNNFINKLCVKSRHDSDELCPINLFIISQNLKSIPSLIRRQSDVFVLLKNSNKEAIIEAISAEIGSHFTKDQVLRAYEYTSSIPYGSLILDIHKATPDNLRMKLGWDNILTLDEVDKKMI